MQAKIDLFLQHRAMLSPFVKRASLDIMPSLVTYSVLSFRYWVSQLRVNPEVSYQVSLPSIWGLFLSHR